MMIAKELRIVFMGTPEFAAHTLRRLFETGYNIVAVVTMPDKPAGRGLKLQQSAVKQYAESVGLNVLQPVNLKDPDFVATFNALEADLGIVIAFRMLPEVIWSAPRLGTFNLHASLLPQYRGAAPINWALINGDSETGVTTFMLNHKIDEGAILARAKVDIQADDNAGTLHDKLMNVGAELVDSSINALATGNYTAISQDDIAEPTLRPAPKIFKPDCHIDFRADGQRIINLIRGLSPYPAAWFSLTDELIVKVFAASFEQGSNGSRSAGTIVTDDRLYIKIACADGFIDLTDLQISGKRRMSAPELLRGFRGLGDYATH